MMFTKLKKKFMKMNMTVIFSILSISFVIVYVIIHASFIWFENINIDKLVSAYNEPLVVKITEINEPDAEWKTEEIDYRYEIISDHTVRYLDGGENGRFGSVTYGYDDWGFLDIGFIPDDGSISRVVSKIANQKFLGEVEVEKNIWKYARQEKNVKVVLSEDVKVDEKYKADLYKYLDEFQEGFKMDFGPKQIFIMNVSMYRDTLQYIRRIMIVTLIAFSVVVYLVSRYFTKRAIGPIEESWNRHNQFVEDASHELKTPLTIIKTNAQTLLDNKDNTIASEEKWVQNIVYESDRMNRLVNDLLNLTEDSNLNHVKKIKFNYSQMLEDTITSIEAIAFEKGLTINSSIDADIFLASDEAKVKEVILNLIDNALKYSKQDSIIHVQLTKGNKTKFVIRNYTDNIDKIDTDKIFDRFYREDEARERSKDSYGLGLSIAKIIVNQLDGSLTVKKDNEEMIFTLEV